MGEAGLVASGVADLVNYKKSQLVEAAYEIAMGEVFGFRDDDIGP